ncbi:MAG: penicillin-binding protein [Oscillospiraceae bacterium]|nr:penicillin-binding protein [Oscillospiraceae bacterium]
MKTVMRRSYAALLAAVLIVCGMALYTYRFVTDGADWASFSGNQAVYSSGVLQLGTLTDRSGVVLAKSADGVYSYADDYLTRVSCLHVVGDYGGSIGTGALTAFADRLTGYSSLTGLADDGAEVALTIDSELNAAAYEALAGRNGAIMVMNYQTGEILCMVSTPAYDPNEGFDESDSAYDGVYINRCISASYVPGSVFKLVTQAAASEHIPDHSARAGYCAASVQVGDNTVTCTGAHGSQTVEQALANSCNCAFAEISLELGGSVIGEYAEKLGFCSELDLNGITVKSGSFDVDDSGSSYTAWSGIGQYNDLVTPYAMLRYVAAIAGGGTAPEPTLLLGESGGTAKLLSAETAEAVGEMMSYAVTYSYGEATFPGLALCAKSGTAEVGDGTSHSWFTGYLTDSEHPYAFVVLIEHGGSGLRNAGAAANTVLQAAVAREY